MHLTETTAVNHFFYSFKDEEITSLVILFSSYSDANEDTLQGNLRISQCCISNYDGL